MGSQLSWGVGRLGESVLTEEQGTGRAGWKTEFMVFDGELKYRATGGDQDRVNGKKGEVLKINFLKGTGSIE